MAMSKYKHFTSDDMYEVYIKFFLQQSPHDYKLKKIKGGTYYP